MACYCRGTCIATPGGETPIETLAIGDPVLTISGAIRAIHWIGRRAYPARQTLGSRAVRPVRVRAGALGKDLPRRDLLVSPEHALMLGDPIAGEVLVPARHLVNGNSIVREAGGRPVEYFHIELDGHDIVLAEGQPAETFIDCDSRAMFDNAGDVPAVKHAPGPRTQFCAPRVEGGAVLARIRRAIDAGCGSQPGPLQGFLESDGPDAIVGWAHDPLQAGAAVLLELCCGDAVISSILADGHRGDLAGINAAEGYCGFSFQPPMPLSPGERRLLTARRAADHAILPRLHPAGIAAAP